MSFSAIKATWLQVNHMSNYNQKSGFPITLRTYLELQGLLVTNLPLFVGKLEKSFAAMAELQGPSRQTAIISNMTLLRNFEF